MEREEYRRRRVVITSIDTGRERRRGGLIVDGGFGGDGHDRDLLFPGCGFVASVLGWGLPECLCVGLRCG